MIPGSIGKRLSQLELVYTRPEPTPERRWDFSALTLEEQLDLYLLLGAESPTHHELRRTLTPAERHELKRLNAMVISL